MVKGKVYVGVLGMERYTRLNQVRLKGLTFEKCY